MKVTIVGGGNIGTQFAVHFAEKGHEVIIFTSQPEVFQNHLEAVDENGNVIHEGDVRSVTADPSEAFTDRDLILVTYPANIVKKAAEAMKPYVSSHAVIGVIPGNGGSECVFREFIEQGNTFFLLERVPSVARLVKKGSVVRASGYRSELHLSALPMAKADACAAVIQDTFDMPCLTVPYLLNITLTPSNPILHTTRLRTIFKDYAPGVLYDQIPLFYQDWTDESSVLLLKCDDEVQAICRAMPEHHLTHVKSLRDHYESYTAEALTKKITSISSFKGLATPNVETGGKYIPDLHSRYFTADFQYGLAVIQQVGRFAGVETPNIDETMAWYESIAVETDRFRYEDYGITDRETFDRFYLG